MGIHYFTSSSNTRLHWIATWILALSPTLLMALSGDHTQQSLGEGTLHWMTHWDHLLVLLLAGGLLGSFKKWGGLGSLIGAASVLMAAWAFSWTPASLNFFMSQGALSASLVPLLVGVFLWQSFVWNPHSHHLVHLKRCGLGMVLLALSMDLARRKLEF